MADAMTTNPTPCYPAFARVIICFAAEHTVPRCNELSLVRFACRPRSDDVTTHRLTLLKCHLSMASTLFPNGRQCANAVGRRFYFSLQYTKPGSSFRYLLASPFSLSFFWMLSLLLILRATFILVSIFLRHIHHGACLACWSHGEDEAVPSPVRR